MFCQGCDEVALTLLDVLDYMEKIPMVTAYKLTDGTTTTRFPMGEALDTAQPVVEYLPGWHCDITAARKWEDLPKEARDYVEYLERLSAARSPTSLWVPSVRLISTTYDPLQSS